MKTLQRPRVRIALALAVGLIAATSGCVVEGDAVYDSVPLPETGGAGGAGGGGDAEGGTAAPPSWAEVEPIMVEKCGACHGDPLAGGAPFALITYADAATYAERSAIRAKFRTMPPAGSPPLTDAEIAILQAWFDAGAPETVEAPPEPAAADWSTIEPILVDKCGACHGATPSQGAPFPLVDYAHAAMYAERSAIRAEFGTMPPQGLGFDPCTADEKALLRAWADAGAPEKAQ
jgi:uncharacterized membrane protein